MKKPYNNAPANTGWPKCMKCKTVAVADDPAADVPDPIFARCPKCGNRWQICGGKNRSGGKCGKLPMLNGRCNNHGGKATGRPLIHGRRSKYLPARLMERAEEALRDPDMVALLEDIAIVEALMIDRLEQLGDESQAALWDRAIEAMVYLSDAVGGLEDGDAIRPEMAALSSILKNGQGRAKAEREIIGFQEHKRKMAETEIKRQHVLNQFVSAKEVNALLAALLSAITKHVKSLDERRAVGAELVGIFRRSAG